LALFRNFPCVTVSPFSRDAASGLHLEQPGGRAQQIYSASSARLGSAEFAHFKLCGLADAQDIIPLVSRLRRLVLSNRFFFITSRISRKRKFLSTAELNCLAQVIAERRSKHGFLITAWVFLPDHWHAILYPPSPLTISDAMEAIKVSSTRRMNRMRGEPGVLWQGRFFDRALRTVKEYGETLEYIHWNPVKAGLVSRPELWPWSSVHQYVRGTGHMPDSNTALEIDDVELPVDQRARI
jgi:putative transposase